MNGWIGVDLDGTLAEYTEWQGAAHIGKPIPLMVERVKKWLADGKQVKIFTARVSNNNSAREESLQAIAKWTEKHIGQSLEVTAEKDYFMVELWDDRCAQVIPNTGVALQDFLGTGTMNPIYHKLAQIAYDTVLQTMQEGEQTHPPDEWQEVDIIDHICHASHHENDYIAGDTSEEHIAHALTRCAMIKYLEAEQAGEERYGWNWRRNRPLSEIGKG
jgi:hypothetical protein